MKGKKYETPIFEVDESSEEIFMLDASGYFTPGFDYEGDWLL